MQSSGKFGPGDMLGLFSSELYATGVRGTCYGWSAAVGKVGGAIGTQAFTPIENNSGKNVPLIIVAIRGVVGILVVQFPHSGYFGDNLRIRDEKFRAYLVSKGRGGAMGDDDMRALAVEGTPPAFGEAKTCFLLGVVWEGENKWYMNGGNSDWTYQLTNCGDGSWCCGSTAACCNTYETFTLDSALIKFISNSDSNSNSSSKSGSASDTSVTSAPSTTGTVNPSGDSSSGSISREKDQSNSDKPKKIAIGVGVGIPLACIAVAMMGVGYFWGRRSMKKELQPRFQPRILNIPLERPKGEIGRPRPEDDASSVSRCLEVVRSA
ncbi:hypothetical protein AnigIFM59636_011978 [Aspergillus niger]|nr:hypothetical protein AnigIFM59636_011978 [Aspergillus niger]